MPATEDIIESVGTKLSISAAKPLTHDATGFKALSYTDVGFLTELGEHGPESSLQTINLMSANIARKRKSIRNYGGMPVTMALVPGDDGQILMRAAEADRDAYSVKLELPDGTSEFFRALVMSFKTNPGNSEATVMATSQLEIDSESVWVDPV